MRMARLFLLLTFLLVAVSPVQAARGVPGSPEFGYGAGLSLEGPYINESLYMSSAAGMDWIAIDVSWRTIEPVTGTYTGLDQLDNAIGSLSGTAALVRLMNPPDWALTAQGPDASATARLATFLADRYSQTELALELFPAANTVAGWGANPDPAVYAALYRQVSGAVAPRPVYLVTAGLRPVATGSSEGIDDLVFLQGLYDAGLQSIMPIISLELVGLHGDPLASPSSDDPFILRHYEQVRQVMKANHHDNGSIWITRLQTPFDTIETSDALVLQQQADWRNQAALQIRSQLYVGMTVFQSLNPAPGNPGLISTSGNQHPFYPIIQNLINQNNANSDHAKPGRPKDIALIKNKT